MKFGRLLKMSLSSIVSNKMRTFLTMLGIIIGISSVIVLVGIGQGAKEQISSQIEKLGTNLITVSITGSRNKSVTNAELDELKKKPGIKDIAPVASGNVNLKAGTNSESVSLSGVTPDFSEIRKMGVQSGRFITQDDVNNRFNVAVIGTETANNLYGTTDVVGQSIYVDGVKYRVVGVLEEQGSSMAGSGDDTIIIPISNAQRLLKNTNIRTFYIEAKDKNSVNTAMGYLELFMENKFNGDTSAFRVFNQSSLLDTANSSTNTLTMMLGGIAAISLIVGGIGIMNIMLVSVIERTREIGIRKAIGAKRKAILLQFLIESSTISGIGGIIGVILGFLFKIILQSILKMNILISSGVVIGAFSFSVAVGVIFGMYPAFKASKLNPIEALRYE